MYVYGFVLQFCLLSIKYIIVVHALLSYIFRFFFVKRNDFVRNGIISTLF